MRKITKFLPLYVMMLPGMIYLLINNYIPMTGIIVAFKKFNARDGIYRSPWNGFDNFTYLFKNDAFIIIRNTLLYNVAFIILNILFGLILAIVVSDIVSPLFKKLYQSFIMLPFLISIVIISYIVYGFLGTENGLLNNTILAENPIAWYQQPKYWPFILMFVNTWKQAGYGALIYIAGIAGIDKTYYEAAVLDGAGKWQQIRRITLPCLVPSIVTLTLLNIGKIFYSDFGLFYQVPQNSGTLFNVTNTIDTYVYRAMISAGGIGRSAAAGFVQSVVGLLLVLLSNYVVRHLSKENAIF